MMEPPVQLTVRQTRRVGKRKSVSLDVCPGKHPHDIAPGASVADAPSPYWRSLQEWAGTEEFERILHREFPAAASEWKDASAVSRRNFLKVMGASLALAGLNAGCDIRGPQEKIVPYVVPPELQQPAKTLLYATAMPFGGYGKGLLVQSFAGRPIKVEGNPKHPASLGATDPFAQASVLELYDPDRSKTVLAGGEGNTWSVLLRTLRERLEAKKATGGAGVRILTETVTSPTLADQIRRFLAQYRNAKWHQYEPVNRDNITAGTVQAFGRPLNPVYHLGRAACIVSLDSNFLYEDPGSLRYSRQFIDGRRLRVRAPESAGTEPATDEAAAFRDAPQAGANGGVWREAVGDNDGPQPAAPAADGEFLANRLYVAESTPTITGTMADNRLRVPPSQVGAVAYALASALKVSAASAPPPPLAADLSRWVQAVAEDLRQTAARHKGAALVVAGPNQPASVHALAHAINVALGAVGVTVVYTEPAEAWPDAKTPVDKQTSLRELIVDMSRAPGEESAVDTLIILGGNPAYTAPANLDFATRLKELSNRRKGGDGPDRNQLVNLTVHLGLHYDETGFNCMWQVPQSHYLESWGDVRTYDGRVSIIQPLIQPLYASHTAHDLLSALLGEPDVTAYEAVRRYWRGQRSPQPQGQNAAPAESGQAADPFTQPDPAFEVFWEKSLQDGIVEGTELPRVQAAVLPNLSVPAPSTPGAGGLEVSFRPDPSVWDGRFANNGWLQELPKPLTKLTWDNAVYVSPGTAERLGLIIGKHDLASVVNLRYRGRRLENVPAWVWPGHPDGSVTIHLGYGRTRAGRVAGLRGDTAPRGFNAYALADSDFPHFGAGLEIEVTGETVHLACTQDHQLVEGRDIARIHKVSDVVAAPPAHPPDKSSNVAERGHGEGEHVSLYPEYDYSKGHAWGMAIDMNACIGCNACTVACQAENNIAVVGPDQVLNGREMHWIRIDTYYRGDPGLDPEAVFQPMLCQHCENAPCEVVCPVAATTHSHEGLNEMTYNRCVGTRYCSNNCPYKVRRFNFLQFQDKTEPVLKLMRNPSVTVRDRGVMEKCTYCVQRLNGARIEVEKLKVQAGEAATPEERQEKERKIHEVMGRLQTACQQACPTEAIVFGDMNYIDSERRKPWVTRLKEQPLHYGVLTELNTQPRTTYLPRLVNANPAIGTPETDELGTRHPSTEARA